MRSQGKDGLRAAFKQLKADVCRLYQTQDYAEAMDRVRTLFRNATPTQIAFIHETALSLNPSGDATPIPLEHLDGLLLAISTEERALQTFAACSPEDAKTLELGLRTIHRGILPALRASGLEQYARLPRPPAGGRPTKKPSSEVCRQICREVERDKVTMGTVNAQERAGKRHGLSTRLVQEICSEYESDTDSISTD
jgi:hypothetical protein